MLYLQYFSEILFPTSVKPRGQPRGRGTHGGSGRGSCKKPSSRKSSPSEQKTKSSSSSSDEGNFGLQIYDLDFSCKYVSYLLKTIDIFYLIFMHIRQRKRWQRQEGF